MSSEVIFRPKSNLFWGIGALALDLLFLAQAFFYPAAGENLIADLLVAVLVATASYLIWIRPKLVLQEKSLLVVNPLRRAEIDYQDITELETKWALLIRHGGGRTRVWVASTNGKQRWISDSTNRWRFAKLSKPETFTGDIASISDSSLSDSGAAATLIRQRIRELH